MSRPNIILTGFMATGKTTVGKMLAEQLDYEFVDTDELIVERSGRTVAEIFREKGEAAFRKMEAVVARELGEKEGLVISTGGRLILDAANATALTRRGRVFCLVATPTEILKRIESDTDVKRPLLEATDPLKRIVEIMQQRESDYSRFPQIVTSGKTPGEVVRNLTEIFQSNSNI
jgi:shikimate kinase